MKKLATIIAGLSLLFTVCSFTPAETNVSSKIKAVFEQDFAIVSNVRWTAYDDIYVASFKEKDNQMSAAYTMEGKLLCIGKSLSIEQLPENVSRALQNKYAGYKINPEIIEITTDVTSYVIYAENEKFNLKIKSDASGNLSVESRTKK